MNINTNWASGRSQSNLETLALADYRCQMCGTTDAEMFIHHAKRLQKAKWVKKGADHVARSGLEQETKFLCQMCHLAGYQGNFRQ